MQGGQGGQHGLGSPVPPPEVRPAVPDTGSSGQPDCTRPTQADVPQQAQREAAHGEGGARQGLLHLPGGQTPLREAGVRLQGQAGESGQVQREEPHEERPQDD